VIECLPKKREALRSSPSTTGGGEERWQGIEDSDNVIIRNKRETNANKNCLTFSLRNPAFTYQIDV
jgi:hypothetical protein